MERNILQNIMNSFKPAEKTLKNRNLNLDLLKMLAAFLVVFYHLAYYKLDYGFTAGVKYFPNFTRIIMCFASCSVPLFFLVNGILMFSKERSWKNVYVKAFKIFLLTIIWSFVGFPSWFFKTLIILYILFPIFQYLKKEHKVLYGLICVGIFLMPFLYNFVVLCIKTSGIKRIATLNVGQLTATGCFTMYSILYFLLGPVLYNRKKYPLWLSLILILVGWGMVVAECTVYTNLNQAVYDGVNAAFPTLGALLLTIGVYMQVINIPLNILKKQITFTGGGYFTNLFITFRNYQNI